MPEDEGREEKERHQNDTDNIKQLIREIKVEVDTFKIIRLGKQITKNKVRPVKVELTEESEKFKISKKAAIITNTEVDKFKKIIITTDMTLKQKKWIKY